jgi:superfamily I DNA/RNA helicase
MTGLAEEGVRWLVDVVADDLEDRELIEMGWLREGWVARVRTAGMRRTSPASPAQPWLDWLAEVDRLAVVDVVVDGPGVLVDLLGFVVEPAVRLGIDLVVVANATLDDLDDAELVEADFRYAHALERLRWLTTSSAPRRGVAPVLPDLPFDPDPRQRDAVTAGGGVVQIIAPAGSGKTAVIVERVRELRRRGVPARSIACVTFNRAAKGELAERLLAGGVGDARALTFHGLGGTILRDARMLREHVGKQPSLGQWRYLAAGAKHSVGEDGVWLDPGDARKHLSDIKLELLLSPQEYAATVTAESDGLSRTLAALYGAYEEQQRADGRMDFDDLILWSLRLLRDDPQARGRWQQRWEFLLVDEYQDIEPAQELLVRILAAPHDQLFCVGDEDQTLYAFRRASVERIICLDEHYPALQRLQLATNYRCPSKVVAASARLIAANNVRFEKRIAAAPGQEHSGAITLRDVARQIDAAAQVAQTLAARRRGEIVVLARTTNALRPVALACADQNVAIDGPAKLFQTAGARLALQQHLQLAVAPARADAALVRAVCQTPGRSLKAGMESAIAAELRADARFAVAFADVPAPRRRPRPGGAALLSPGDLFCELAACRDASVAVELLRGEGGLDDWFEQSDGLGGLDDFESEVLEQAQREARGLSIDAFLSLLIGQSGQLAEIRDRDNGIELSTIHGAKGREWPHVVVVSCDDRVLPHARALEVGAEELARGDGIEAERRLAYVAFTRAKEHLELYYDKQRPSRFLIEAGLLSDARAAQPRAARRAPRVPQPPGMKRAGTSVYVDAVEVARGNARHSRNASDADTATLAPASTVMSTQATPADAKRLRTAGLIAARRMPRRTTIGGLATQLHLSTGELASVLQAVDRAGARTKLRELDEAQTAGLARVVRELA